MTGKNIFTYTSPEMGNPIGLTVDDKGYVLVACLRSNDIHRISPDGSYSKIIISEIPPNTVLPFIYFNKTSKSVIIGHENQILVYTQQ